MDPSRRALCVLERGPRLPSRVLEDATCLLARGLDLLLGLALGGEHPRHRRRDIAGGCGDPWMFAGLAHGDSPPGGPVREGATAPAARATGPWSTSGSLWNIRDLPSIPGVGQRVLEVRFAAAKGPAGRATSAGLRRRIMRVSPPGPPMRFDAEFYRRFYEDPATRVASADEARRLGDFIGAYAAYLGVRVGRVLDAGCGLGQLRPPLLERFPRARYVGLEVSEYLARRHGWVHARLEDYRPRAAFDLVVCHDVLQYLDDRAAARALANLARLSRGLLYLSVLTLEDWRRAADRSRTDRDVHLRPVDWYRRRLARSFLALGGGMFARRGRTPVLWAIERAPAG